METRITKIEQKSGQPAIVHVPTGSSAANEKENCTVCKKTSERWSGV